MDSADLLKILQDFLEKDIDNDTIIIDSKHEGKMFHQMREEFFPMLTTRSEYKIVGRRWSIRCEECFELLPSELYKKDLHLTDDEMMYASEAARCDSTWTCPKCNGKFYKSYDSSDWYSEDGTNKASWGPTGKVIILKKGTKYKNLGSFRKRYSAPAET